MDAPQQPPRSIRQQIKTRVLNMTIGQWMRAIDMVLSEYTSRGGSVEDEADYVTKLALLLMLTRWYDENDICLLLDSSALRIPKRIAESTKFDLTRILDRPSEEGTIEDFTYDDDASPAHRPEGSYEMTYEPEPEPEEEGEAPKSGFMPPY